METPIYSKLQEYGSGNRVSFAMPGHKNGRGLKPDALIRCDVTELAHTVDLHHESDEVRRANELLAQRYGAAESFIMTGGSTAGIQAMLASVLKPGDTLLAAADCHMSVINTCAICGYKVRLLPVLFDEDFGVPYGLGEYELTEDVRAVLITSPNYYGTVKNVREAAEKCHEAGVPLLVDEAHGAHFAALENDELTAVGIADMVCHSAHKTLNAMTGAAYLHISRGALVDVKRVKRSLAAFQSSSPSYPIAASADIARAAMRFEEYAALKEWCEEFMRRAEAETDIRFLRNHDPARIVMNFGGYDITGYEVQRQLADRFAIDAEMADSKNLVLIATPWNSAEDFRRLYNAVIGITEGSKRTEQKKHISPPPVTEELLSPAEAWYAEAEPIPVEAAQGRVAAETLTVYPPGTPIIIMGEKIRQCTIEYINQLRAAGAEPAEKIEVIK